jgi:hypothetical protein
MKAISISQATGSSHHCFSIHYLSAMSFQSFEIYGTT